MSSSSSNQTLEELRYSFANCRQCGIRTGVGISSSSKNPGRLYYKCPTHGWSGWAVPINGERENVSENAHLLRRRTVTEEGSVDNGHQIGVGPHVCCKNQCNKHSIATLVVMSLCLLVNIIVLITIAVKD